MAGLLPIDTIPLEKFDGAFVHNGMLIEAPLSRLSGHNIFSKLFDDSDNIGFAIETKKVRVPFFLRQVMSGPQGIYAWIFAPVQIIKYDVEILIFNE